MWCTRWFLPLLLLPLPTAPPYFLLLFLFSLTMHAKPCVYCIVLLTTLFVSSCYWQPFPLDSPLSTPWTENITTFSEALNATIMSNYSKPLPNIMRTVDRCWCDFSVGGFFEPFNVTHWEYVSIQRLKDDLERQQKAEEAASKTEAEQKKANLPSPSTSSLRYTGLIMPRISPPSDTSSPGPNTISLSVKSLFRLFRDSMKRASLPAPIPSGDTYQAHVSPSSIPDSKTQPRPPDDHGQYPLIRKEYDLRPYGVGILVDFGWT